MYKVNYKEIYDFLATTKRNTITASGIAFNLGIDRIYGGTMAKLVRDGYLEECPCKGYYRIIKREE